MSSKLRIATFNCENLFARYKFKRGVDAAEISPKGWDINKVYFKEYDPASKELTGRATMGTKADVVVLQEVENMEVLKRFRTEHLRGFKSYPHLFLVDGNDPRRIDIAVISKYPIVHGRTFQHVKKSPNHRSFVFSRDCLEVDIKSGGGVITLYANHFKSMMGGRKNTRQRRVEQAKTVRKIITERFGANPGGHPFIVLGDFNDYMETDPDGRPGIGEIVKWDQVENVALRLPAGEQWTHYYKGADTYRQLDYILVSKSLGRKVKKVQIERRGMPLRATRYSGPRFPGVGRDRPKASDHCPLVVELEM